ncbi:CLUMA_CG003198, isoform D, partial [Clunio marinus]
TKEISDLLTKYKSILIDDLLSNKSVLQLLVEETIIDKNDFEYLLQSNVSESENELNDKKCQYLIDIISKDGLKCFKKFCYTIETDCKDLITALINDSLNYGNSPKNSNGESSASSSNNDRDLHESSRSPTPLIQPNHQPPNTNNNHHINSRSKRFSSPPYSDYGCDKVNSRNLNGKIGKRNIRSMNEAIEVLADQVEEENVGERTSWEYHTVILYRVAGYGFGIAVSGGRDNPHFANGDPSIAVSDVLKGGPAEDRLQTNDRIVSANGISLENVEYATAVQVLRDSGNTVTLVVKRRVPSLQGNYSQSGTSSGIIGNHQHQHSLSSTAGLMGLTNGSQQQIKVTLNKSSKKEDFGLVLGCRIFVKEISSKMREQLQANGYSLQEGDIITRVHNTNCNDSMSVKEAKKIMDGCKERLNLAVVRDPNLSPTSSTNNNNNASIYSHQQQLSNCSNIDDNFNSSAYSTQNLYVQPPTRPSLSTLLDDKCNLTPRGRSRGPLTDISLTQLDRPVTPPTTSGHSRSRSGIDEPPRPPPPRGEDYYSTRRMTGGVETSSEPRYITFQKEGSVGIRLTGGNEVGIFVTAVQQNSPASMQGLVPGDKLLKVNDMDMNGVTREEAVLFLLSLQDRIDLIVQYCKDEYDNVIQNQRGDSFHIKTHFHYDSPSKSELSFRAGDVFRVIDTLHNGVVGSWQVMRIGRGHQELQRGIIPNKARAEELATAQFNASKKELNTSESRVSFFRRKRSNHRRSKSLSRENWDDVVFSDSISKFPAYERVVLRHPGFIRPVVLFGAVADLARERLIKDFSDKFTAPLQDDDKSSSKCGIVRLSNIRDIMDRGKHALLDITPNAVDRLNYAQFYPIVIFLKADSKHSIKTLRQGIPKSAHKSSKKLLEQSQKLDRVWSHVFSTTITLNDPDSWYRKVRETIDKQQSGAVWMSETKESRFTSDLYFPYTLSSCPYACCNSLRRSYCPPHASSAFSNYQRPRYSMPIPAPVNYQIVPIRRHSNSYYRSPSRSMQNLNSFAPNRYVVDDNNNSSSRYGTLRNAEERRSPYYYNELTRMHDTNNHNQLPQFPLIDSSCLDSSHQFNCTANDDNFTDFINTINPVVVENES